MANYSKHIITPSARLCFPALFEPKSFDEGQPGKYGCILVFPKGTDLSGLKGIIQEAYNAEFTRGTQVRSPLRDGNEKADEWGVAFRDATFVRVSSKIKPPVYDDKSRPVTDPGVMYSGCVVRAEIHAAAYNKLGNKGVTLYLDGIQRIQDGPRIGVDHEAATRRAFESAPIGGAIQFAPEETAVAPMPTSAETETDDSWI